MTSSITNTAEIFKSLGDPSRLKILKLIAAKGNNMCVGKIARTLKMTQPAVSQHLKVLKNTGLVEADKKGYHVHYSIKMNSLGVFGIDTKSFLATIGAEINFDTDCGEADPAECDKVNK